ncbi:MAG: OmpH family outer membrane protein [Muribaculaceae bacterium]|nr:OmpH family outer membrane protein [Muribaculaceae bacterium]
MIKKALLAIMLALPMLAAAQAQIKIGTVQIDPIVDAMPETAQMKTQLEADQKTYQDELEKLGAELDKKVAEYQKLAQDGTTPQSILERRMQEVQELQQKAQLFSNQAQQEMQRKYEQLMAPVQEKLTNAIKAVGAENGFTLILPEGVAAYQSTDVIDATPLVKARLGIK